MEMTFCIMGVYPENHSRQGYSPGMEEGKERARKRVAVIMQRRTLESRWQNEAWEPVGVVSDYDGEGGARVIVDEGSTTQWLYPGFDIDLRRDEADGYYMNVSTQQPSVFVLWRMEAALAVPQFVTVSYAEAARWMDAGERVDQQRERIVGQKRRPPRARVRRRRRRLRTRASPRRCTRSTRRSRSGSRSR